MRDQIDGFVDSANMDRVDAVLAAVPLSRGDAAVMLAREAAGLRLHAVELAELWRRRADLIDLLLAGTVAGAGAVAALDDARPDLERAGRRSAGPRARGRHALLDPTSLSAGPSLSC